MSATLLSRIWKTEIDQDLDSTVLYKAVENSPDQEGLVDSMKEVLDFLKSHSLITIDTPYRGTSIELTKDEKKFVFCSQDNGNENETSCGKGSRLGVVDLNTEEIVLDKKVSNDEILTICLSPDSEYIFSGGREKIIFKYQLSSLSKVDHFEGHTDSITKLVASFSNEWLFSSSCDGTVRMWNFKGGRGQSCVLVDCKKAIFALDLSQNDQYLCAGGETKKLYLYSVSYSINEPGKILNELLHDCEIWCVKISHNCTFVAFGDQKGKIKLVDFHNLNTLKEFSMSEMIVDLDISSNEEILISASLNTDVKIWFLTQGQEVSYEGHTGCVKRIIFMNGDTKAVSISDDSTIKIWKVPEPERETIFLSDEDLEIIKIWTEDKNIKYLAYKNSEIVYSAWSQFRVLIDTMKITSDMESAVEICPAMQLIIYSEEANDGTKKLNDFAIEQDASILNILNLQTCLVEKRKFVPFQAKVLYLTESLKHLICLENFRLFTFDFSTLTLIETFFIADIQGIAMTVNNENFYVSGHNKIFFFNLNSATGYVREKEFKQYNQPIRKVRLYVTENSEYLFILSNKFLEIIDCGTFITLLNIAEGYTGCFENINKTIFLYSEKFIDIYSLVTLQKLTRISKQYTITNALTSNNFNDIIFCNKGVIFKTENYLNVKQLTLVGDYKYLERFQIYIGDLLEKKCTEPFFESLWLIEPMHINLLHVYAYMNNGELLRKSIIGSENKQIPFICSQELVSPLTVAIKLDYADCINSIIYSLIKKIKLADESDQLSQMLLKNLENDITELTSTGNRLIHKLFAYILRPDFSNYLPNCIPRHFKIPQIMKNQRNFFIASNELRFDAESLTIGRAVIFKKTLTRFNLELGSSKSLAFMKSLETCPNHKIFDTEFIRTVLSQKWKLTKPIMYLQSFIYVIYLMLLSLYTCYEPARNKAFLVAPFAFSLLLYLYECIFMKLEGREYFNNFWNIIDSFRSWLTIFYCSFIWTQVFDISTDKNENEKYLLALVIFISWMRGVTYFRINKKTRYFVGIFYHVSIEMFPFLTIFFYSIIAVALVFRGFEYSKDSDFFVKLCESYLIVIGNWGNPTDPNFYSLVLLIATLLNPVISLNLLISILTDTFNTVKEKEKVADLKELVVMIIEIETLMFWKRDNNLKVYLHIVDKDSKEEEDENKLMFMTKKLSTKVKWVNNEIDEYRKQNEKLAQKVSLQSKLVKNVLSQVIDKTD